MNEKIKIQSNIKIPQLKTTNGRKLLYPFPLMKVGDSFFAAGKNQNVIRVCAKSWCLRSGFDWKFSTLSSTEKVNGVDTKGARCWRIS